MKYWINENGERDRYPTETVRGMKHDRQIMVILECLERGYYQGHRGTELWLPRDPVLGRCIRRIKPGEPLWGPYRWTISDWDYIRSISTVVPDTVWAQLGSQRAMDSITGKKSKYDGKPSSHKDKKRAISRANKHRRLEDNKVNEDWSITDILSTGGVKHEKDTV